MIRIYLLSLFSIISTSIWAWSVPSEVFLCPGQSSKTIEISQPRYYNFEWYDDSTCQLKLGEGSSITISNEKKGKSIYVKADTDPKESVQEIKIKEADPITLSGIKQSNNGILCKGGEVLLSADLTGNTSLEGVTFAWYKDNSFMGNDSTLSAKSLGNYTLEVTKQGCTTTQKTVITQEKKISRISGSDAVCSGGNVNIEVGGMDTYQWSGEGLTNTTGNKNQISKAGVYTVVGNSQEGGCEDTYTFTISEKEQLDVDIEGVTALCPGEASTILTASIPGIPNNMIQFMWTNKKGDVIGTTPSISVDEEDDYKVSVSAEGCNGETNKTIKRIKDVPPTSINGDNEMVICAGKSKQILAEGDNLNSFIWRKADGEIIDKTSGEIKLKEDGYYMVTGYTKDGCVSDTVSFHLTVKENPILTFPVYYPCEGDTITIEADFEEGTTFTWTIQDSEIDKSNPNLTIFQEGKYTGFVSDPKTSCTTSNSVEITFPKYPVINAPDSVFICEKSSKEIDVTVEYGTEESYKWTDKSGKILSAKSTKIIVSEAGEYHFLAENEHGCSSEKIIVVATMERPHFTLSQFPQFLCNQTDTVHLTAQSLDAKSFSWSKDNRVKGASKELNVNESGSYILTIIGNNGCISDTTITVASKSQAKITTTIDTICEGSSGKIHLSSDIACDYIWPDGSTGSEYEVNRADIYTVKATDRINHCSQTVSIQVDLYPKAIFKLSNETLNLCEGDSSVIYSSKSKNKYHSWNGVEITNSSAKKYLMGRNGTLSESNELIIKEAGEYSIIGISEEGCASDTASVTVIEKKKPTISWDIPDTFCFGDTLKISPVVIGAEPLSYEWSDNSRKEWISIFQEGQYHLTVTDANGCAAELEKEVHTDKPQVEIIGEKEFCSDSTLKLTAQGDAEHYFWNNETTSKNSFIVTQGGQVSLKAVSKFGCEAIATQEVIQRERPLITMDSIAYFCENMSTELIPEMNTPASKYTWDGDENNNQVSLSVNEEGIHSIIGYDKWNCPSLPCSIRVQMTETPIVQIKGKDIVCEEGDPVILIAEVQNGYDYNEWNNGERSDSILIKNGGQYIVTAHVGRCASSPDTFNVEFIHKPQISINGAPQFCTDSTITLTAEGNVSIYHWNDDSTNTKLHELSNSEAVTLTGIDEHGCRSSVTEMFIQREKPVIHIDSVIYYCENSFIDLRAEMDSVYGKFIWNGTEKSTSNTYKADHEGVYTVKGYDLWNCPSEEVKTQVKMTQVPKVEIVGQNYVCENGEPTRLSVQVSGINDRLEWNTHETSDTILSQSGGQYIVKAFIGVCASLPDTFDVEFKNIPELSIEEGESVEFCDSLSVTIHAKSPTAKIFRWSPGDNTSPSIEVDSMGVYTVFAEDEFGCVNHKDIQAIAIPGPQMRVIGDTTLCELGTTIISLDCPNCVRQTWNTGDTSDIITIYESGIYTVEGIDSNGCPNKISHNLRITQAPTLLIEGDREITGNDSTVLTAVATGEAPFRYYWTPTKEMSSSITVSSDDFDQQENYSVIVYDKNGCYNFTTIAVTKHSVKLNGKKNFCEGESSILTAIGDGITSYLWSTGDTTPSIMVTQAGLYSIITTHKIGLSDTLRFEVVVHPKPQVEIIGDRSLCKGDSLFLFVSSDTEKNLWNTGSSQDSITVRDKGLYTVVATSSFGCVNQDSVEVTLFEIPDVSINGPDTILEGGSISLQANGAISYHWESPDTISESIEISEGGQYKVIGTDANNCQNSAFKKIRMIPVPHPLINDTTNGHTIACVDDKVMLVASGANNYIWDTGETNDTIYANESRIYTVIGCLNNGQCDSAHFSVELSPHPRMMSIEGNKHICPGDFTIFTAHTYEDSLISHFIWSTKENTPSINVKDTGVYSVKAVSKYGCLSDSILTKLDFYPLPSPNISGINEICEGNTTTLHAEGGHKYLWLENQSTNEYITIHEQGTYTLRAWNEHGCTADTSIHVAYRGKPNIKIDGEDHICQGDSALLSVTGDQFLQNHYLWNTGDTTNSIIVKKEGVYSVSLTNKSGCEATDTLSFIIYPTPIIQIEGPDIVCANDSILLTCRQLTHNKIEKYIWDNETKDSLLAVKTAHIYTLQVQDDHTCFSDVVQHEVKVRTPNPITVTGDFDICNQQEDNAKIIASNEGATIYLWLSPEGDTLSYKDASLEAHHAGTYRILTIDSFGCSIHKDITIKGHDAPNVRIQGAEKPVCGLPSAILSIDSNPLFQTISWGNGSTDSQITCNESGDYSISVIDTLGCIGKDTVHLVLNDIPQMNIEGDFGFCPDSFTDIIVHGAESYLWNMGASDSIIRIFKEGDYSVGGTDQYGCKKNISFHVTRYQMPSVDLVETPSKISRIDPEVKFIAFSDEDISNCFFLWSMGDGNNMEGKEFSYTFDISEQRWFNVTMTVQSTDGCVDSKMVTLGVDLEIPNTITPNGDGINDEFMKGFNVEIFDRHGERVFIGEDGWDGQLKGKSVTADTYYYVLTDITGEIYRGYLTVRK